MLGRGRRFPKELRAISFPHRIVHPAAVSALEIIVGHNELSLHLAEVTRCPWGLEAEEELTSGLCFYLWVNHVVSGRKRPQRLCSSIISRLVFTFFLPKK